MATVDRFWVKNYPKGVPADIDVNQYESLVQLLDEAFKKYGSLPAYTCMGVTMTYRQLDENSAAIGAWLQSKGLGKGKRVAIMMPNILQYPVVLAGVLRAGATVVNVNPLYTPRELEHQLKDSGADAIFILENFATTLQQVQDKVPTKTVVRWGGTWRETPLTARVPSGNTFVTSLNSIIGRSPSGRVRTGRCALARPPRSAGTGPRCHRSRRRAVGPCTRAGRGR